LIRPERLRLRTLLHGLLQVTEETLELKEETEMQRKVCSELWC
jgi:hypothetical protein